MRINRRIPDIRWLRHYTPRTINEIDISVKKDVGRGASAEEAIKFMSEKIAKRRKTSESPEYDYERIPEDKSGNHLSHGRGVLHPASEWVVTDTKEEGL